MGFDAGIGLSEMVIIGVVALLVVGPKDLPLLMRKVGGWIRKMRAMASDFQNSFDELARQSELDELRKELDELRDLNPMNKVQSEINSVLDFNENGKPFTGEPLTFDDVNSDAAIRQQEDFAAQKAKEQIAKAKRKSASKTATKAAPNKTAQTAKKSMTKSAPKPKTASPKTTSAKKTKEAV